MVQLLNAARGLAVLGTNAHSHGSRLQRSIFRPLAQLASPIMSRRGRPNRCPSYHTEANVVMLYLSLCMHNILRTPLRGVLESPVASRVLQ
jgi:hypothetical protein